MRLDRAPGQVVKIGLDKDINPDMTVSQLFGNGPIEVMVMHSCDDKATLLVTTPQNFSVDYKEDGLF